MAKQEHVPRKLAIGRQLRHCSSVHCLGVHANLADYPPEDLDLIRRADKIYYPTILLAEALTAMGKAIFPSVQTIRYAGDKIRQTLLFQILDLPMPRTRVYYGPRQKKSIPDDFCFPFIAKVPRDSSQGRGVSLIRNRQDLAAYLRAVQPAYIQEYLPLRKNIRVVVLGGSIIHAYWRRARPGDFRTNVAQGGSIDLAPVPQEALDFALRIAKLCRFDQVGLDLCEFQDRYLVLEANMTFGFEGFKAAGLNFRDILRNMVENDEI